MLMLNENSLHKEALDDWRLKIALEEWEKVHVQTEMLLWGEYWELTLLMMKDFMESVESEEEWIKEWNLMSVFA